MPRLPPKLVRGRDGSTSGSISAPFGQDTVLPPSSTRTSRKRAKSVRSGSKIGPLRYFSRSTSLTVPSLNSRRTAKPNSGMTDRTRTKRFMAKLDLPPAARSPEAAHPAWRGPSSLRVHHGVAWGPFNHQARSGPTHIHRGEPEAVFDRKEGNPPSPYLGVEMRRRMVIIVHAD